MAKAPERGSQGLAVEREPWLDREQFVALVSQHAKVGLEGAERATRAVLQTLAERRPTNRRNASPWTSSSAASPARASPPDAAREHAGAVMQTLREAVGDDSPLRPAERERFWFEWRRLGRLLGVRERDLPVTVAEFDDYLATMVSDVLEDTAAVRDVLAVLGNPASSPLPRFATPLWQLGRLPLGHGLRLTTIGLLPPILRERFGLTWSRAEELELRLAGGPAVAPPIAARLRAGVPALAQRRGA
jgi:uncharacterized protein (DUF2236 family)